MLLDFGTEVKDNLYINIAGATRSSAIAEGLSDALVSTNLATTKHPILKRLQSTNDREVYTPKVIVIAAFRKAVYHVLLLECLYLAPFLRYYHF